jgi:hypothetical protein
LIQSTCEGTISHFVSNELHLFGAGLLNYVNQELSQMLGSYWTLSSSAEGNQKQHSITQIATTKLLFMLTIHVGQPEDIQFDAFLHTNHSIHPIILVICVHLIMTGSFKNSEYDIRFRPFHASHR